MAASPADVKGESVRRDTESAPARVRVGGVWFDNVTMGEAIERIEGLVRSKRPAMVVTPNVDHVVRVQKSRGYANLVRRADLVLADGQPIVWVSRLLGTSLKERVAGSDLFPLLCEHAAGAGHRVFFLGGDPGAASPRGDGYARVGEPRRRRQCRLRSDACGNERARQDDAFPCEAAGEPAERARDPLARRLLRYAELLCDLGVTLPFHAMKHDRAALALAEREQRLVEERPDALPGLLLVPRA